MATVSTVPARPNEGPSGRRPRVPRSGERLITPRRVVRGIGKTLIAAGILIFLFVGYELWGTGLAERRDQKKLKQQFTQTAPPTVDPGASPPPTEPAALGTAVGEIQIPKIGVDKFVVEGVGVEDLKQGPGHYPGTPMPGEAGNAAIAGHRTTYGAPFNRLDELGAGDPIMIRTHQGQFRYAVDHSVVVSPSDVSVLSDTPDNRLTLTTCHPKYSAARRLVVVARLVGQVVTAPRPPPVAQAPARPRLEAGLSGKRAPRGPAVLWGALAALVWFLAWFVGHRWRRWAAYLLAAPVFLVVLFVFFENVSRLLPANV